VTQNTQFCVTSGAAPETPRSTELGNGPRTRVILLVSHIRPIFPEYYGNPLKLPAPRNAQRHQPRLGHLGIRSIAVPDLDLVYAQRHCDCGRRELDLIDNRLMGIAESANTIAYKG